MTHLIVHVRRNGTHWIATSPDSYTTGHGKEPHKAIVDFHRKNKTPTQRKQLSGQSRLTHDGMEIHYEIGDDDDEEATD